MRRAVDSGPRRGHRQAHTASDFVVSEVVVEVEQQHGAVFGRQAVQGPGQVNASDDNVLRRGFDRSDIR